MARVRTDSAKFRLWLHHIHVRMSPRVPQHSCSPFCRAWVSKWPNGMVGEQDYVPCSVLRAARMSLCLGGSQPFSTPAHCKISFWEDSASHLFLLGPSMLPPSILPNLNRFLKQFQLNGFSISLIKSAPARSAAHPCKQEFPAGQLLSEKKVWIFSWKMISSKQNYVAS